MTPCYLVNAWSQNEGGLWQKEGCSAERSSLRRGCARGPSGQGVGRPRECPAQVDPRCQGGPATQGLMSSEVAELEHVREDNQVGGRPDEKCGGLLHKGVDEKCGGQHQYCIERLTRAQAMRARPRRRGLPQDDGGERSVIADKVLDRQSTSLEPIHIYLDSSRLAACVSGPVFSSDCGLVDARQDELTIRFFWLTYDGRVASW